MSGGLAAAAGRLRAVPAAGEECTHGLARQGPWQLAWASVVGSRHAEAGLPCEDVLAHRFHPQGGLSVAGGDGVSGGALGQVGADAAVRHCTEWALPPGDPEANDADAADSREPPALRAHVQQLDAVVRQAIARYTARTGATTLAAAWLQGDGTGWLTHVGDMRAYLWTPATATAPGHLEGLSKDQSYTLLSELPPPGVPAENPARMCGNGSAGNPPLQALALAPGQLLMLCSDGVHGFVPDRELAYALDQGLGAGTGRASASALARLPRRLLRKALANGSDDDIALMLLHWHPTAA